MYKKNLWAVLIKMNVPVDDVKEMMGEIGGRGMGYLFENMEKMDIQAERRNTQREKKRADEAEKENLRLQQEILHLQEELARLQKKE